MREFDLVVVGGGSGGVRAARIAAGYGARVALVEAHRLGGTCVIRGCVPKKLMVYASRFAQDFEEAAGYGWRIDGDARLDWPTLKQRRDAEVARLEGLYRSGLDSVGVTLFHDTARFQDVNTLHLAASGEALRAKHVLVATGAWPTMGAAIPGIELADTSNDFFDWPRLPHRAVIQGGGYIAVEFACLLQRMGTQVTLVLRGERILRGFDDDLRARLHAQMVADGIEILTGVSITSIEAVGSARLVTLSDERTLTADEVLFALGRRPHTQGLGLEGVGVELDERGAVKVDAHSRSSVPHIYAVGDVTDRIHLTPIAIREGHAFADTVFGQRPRAVDHHNVPSAVFSTPELGTVGLNEDEALRERPELDVYTADFRPLKSTLSGHTHRVFMKLLVDRADDERVVGFHMLGTDAAEMIQLMAVAIKMGARKCDLDATVAVHPTIAEEWVTMRAPTRQHKL